MELSVRRLKLLAPSDQLFSQQLCSKKDTDTDKQTDRPGTCGRHVGGVLRSRVVEVL